MYDCPTTAFVEHRKGRPGGGHQPPPCCSWFVSPHHRVCDLILFLDEYCLSEGAGTGRGPLISDIEEGFPLWNQLSILVEKRINLNSIIYFESEIQNIFNCDKKSLNMNENNERKIILTFFITILLIFIIISGCTTINNQENQTINDNEQNNSKLILTLKDVQNIDQFDQKYPKLNHKFVGVSIVVNPDNEKGNIVEIGSYDDKRFIGQVASLKTDASSSYSLFGKEYFNLRFKNPNDLFGGGYILVNGTITRLVFEIPASESPKSINIPYFVDRNNTTEVESIVISL